jgi:hypothetical protein
MSLSVIGFILFFHFLADFIFQDREWATEKYHDIDALTQHVLAYCLVFGIALWWFKPSGGSFGDVLVFVIITYVCHFITDYITSKGMHQYAEDKNWGTTIPNVGFFSLLGFDQALHYLQLFGTYYFVYIYGYSYY